MQRDEFEKLRNDVLAEAFGISSQKRKGYAGDDRGQDVLANFKRVAERIGITKYQALDVYFMKHVDSLNNAIKQNPYAPVDPSEHMRGRIIDTINYALLLAALLEEDRLLRQETEDDEEIEEIPSPYGRSSGHACDYTCVGGRCVP